ncbi:hypothetical protein BGZ65_001842 [Modicella reniformis]|uniref:Uncharacterized protein n=1 Tax=Modicella reniformis TaxID=1440133 RepID=A0A9P6SMT2_9FUNG|nr:hypothetical protein BGZ65_001842 [Modicella reniformis]
MTEFKLLTIYSPSVLQRHVRRLSEYWKQQQSLKLARTFLQILPAMSTTGYALSTYLVTDGIQVYTSSKANPRVINIKKRFPDKDAGVDHREVVFAFAILRSRMNSRICWLRDPPYISLPLLIEPSSSDGE